MYLFNIIMYYITVVKRGDDSGRVVQWAKDLETAQRLIELVLPPTQYGFNYRIIKS